MKLDYFRYPVAALAATFILAYAFAPTGAKAGDKAPSAPLAPVGKSGAQLWAEQCQRCHNVRSPSSYSPAQWEVAMLHMRVRANLTPEQHQKILEFLKAGS
jgi:cytochrome c5